MTEGARCWSSYRKLDHNPGQRFEELPTARTGIHRLQTARAKNTIIIFSLLTEFTPGKRIDHIAMNSNSCVFKILKYLKKTLYDHEYFSFFLICSLIFCLGPVSVIVFALPLDELVEKKYVYSHGIVTSIGALAIGCFFGFIFGLPKSTGKEKPHTNLEEISDWLTKILLGASLTQIGNVPDGLMNIAEAVAEPWAVHSIVNFKWFIVTILLYATVTGFFMGYVYTRMQLFNNGENGKSDPDPHAGA